MENSPNRKLKLALEELNRSKESVEKAFEDLEAQDLNKENENLRQDIINLTGKLEKNQSEYDNLISEYHVLEKNFKEELNQKWIANLNVSEKNMQSYLDARLENQTKKLDNLQQELKYKTETLTAGLKILEDNERKSLLAEIDYLKTNIDNRIAEIQRQKDEAWAEILEDKSKSIENMSRDINIESDALRAVRKFFSWESFLGLKLISSLGILLIIIGVFTFGRYVYLQMNPQMQCAAIFGLGLVFLIAGEILNKKWHGVFSLAITAGGSAILFLGTALGYFALEVLSMELALGLCAGVSVLSFVLSIRHSSQVIAVFALIGGYMPVLALESGSEIIIWGAIYFAILNIFSLALSTRRNWKSVRFIGLFAGLAADLNLIILSWDSKNIIIIMPLVLAYISYLIIPVFGAFFTKSKIKSSDIWLLALNIFFRFMLGILTVYVFGFEKYQAVLPAFFMLTCIIMAVLCEKGAYKIISEKEKGSLNALFFVTSITFAVLIVLFWFDKVWFSSGWLVESAGLLIYGLWKNRRKFIVSGAVIGGICLLGFIFINVPNYQSSLFVWQYLFITLGLTAAFILIGVRQITKKYEFAGIFQFAASLNVWIFIIYLFNNPVLDYLRRIAGISGAGNICVLFCIVFGMMYSYGLPKIRAVYSTGVHTAAIFAGVCSSLWLIIFNFTALNTSMSGESAFLIALVIIIYIFTNFIGVLWMRDLLQLLVLKRIVSLNFYPITISGYCVLLVSQNLLTQLNLEPSSIILTAVFGVTALCWIIFGFNKRNSITRISGLALSFFSVIKLFLLDLKILSTELRIVSYFAMGILLLAISFIYQYFNKKLKD